MTVTHYGITQALLASYREAFAETEHYHQDFREFRFGALMALLSQTYRTRKVMYDTPIRHDGLRHNSDVLPK